jgi:hypothetical protein
MSSQKKELSHVRKYFLRLQDVARGFVLGLPCVIFLTVAAWINGELDVFVLMMIWSVGLPGIILIFRCLSLMSAKYTDVPCKKILFSGKYEDLVLKLFNDGFQLQSKIDDYYQFTSNVSLVHRHVLIVNKEGTQYSLFGEEEIIKALSDDMGATCLKIDPVCEHAEIKENNDAIKMKI